MTEYDDGNTKINHFQLQCLLIYTQDDRNFGEVKKREKFYMSLTRAVVMLLSPAYWPSPSVVQKNSECGGESQFTVHFISCQAAINHGLVEWWGARESGCSWLNSQPLDPI